MSVKLIAPKTFHRHKRTQIEKHLQKKTLDVLKLFFVWWLSHELTLSCSQSCAVVPNGIFIYYNNNYYILLWLFYFVVPENIHTLPPHGRDWKFWWGGGCVCGDQRPRNFRRRGGGRCFNDFFFSRPVSIFIQLCVKFCCLHFVFLVMNAKKINLANLKHKMNIFVLVRLDILVQSVVVFTDAWQLGCIANEVCSPLNVMYYLLI